MPAVFRIFRFGCGRRTQQKSRTAICGTGPVFGCGGAQQRLSAHYAPQKTALIFAFQFYQGVGVSCGVPIALSTSLKKDDTSLDQASKAGIFFSERLDGVGCTFGVSSAGCRAQPLKETASIVTLSHRAISVLANFGKVVIHHLNRFRRLCTLERSPERFRFGTGLGKLLFVPSGRHPPRSPGNGQEGPDLQPTGRYHPKKSAASALRRLYICRNRQ